jgi:hypothetical protein
MIVISGKMKDFWMSQRVEGGVRMDINNLVTFMISLLLALSALLLVAEAVGLLPDRVSRWLNRKRLAQTISVLRELGLDIDRVKRGHIAMELVEHFQPASLPERVKTNLESLTFKKTVGVGSTEVVQAHQYIDLMGGTNNPAVATMFSRYPETFWRDRILASAADPTIRFCRDTKDRIEPFRKSLRDQPTPCDSDSAVNSPAANR